MALLIGKKTGRSTQHRLVQLGRLLTLGFGEQNFLGQPWVPLTLRLVPKPFRRTAALRLLAMSPHYFVDQWSPKYGANMTRREILEAEYQRNVAARHVLCEQVLQPHLTSGLTVMEFGCGPGWLVQAVAEHVGHVHGVDISCGAIACARALGHAANVSFHVNDGGSLSTFETDSMDLIYSFAVVQHLTDELFEGYLHEFLRVLKPAGKMLCHIALDDTDRNDDSCQPRTASHISEKIKLRMMWRSPERVERQVMSAGFERPHIQPLREVIDIDDDVARQHLMILRKPSCISPATPSADEE